MGPRTSPPPLAAVAVLLLLVSSFSFHCAAAARPLPDVALARHENGVKQDSADDLVLHQEGAGAVAGNGDELLSVSEIMGGAEEACEEGNDLDECMQRRLLRDAHLDYIYTQHKGKP